MCDWKMASLLFLQVVISCSIFGLNLMFNGGNSVDARLFAKSKENVPKYQLVYFDRQGRAEISRWMFAYGGIHFQDIRIQGQDWPTLKLTVPNGQLPYLQVEGKTNLSESMAIARFVARKSGLVGRDDLEAAQADAIVDYINDATQNKIPAEVPIKTRDDKARIQKYLDGLQGKLQANGHFVGSQDTWADLYAVVVLDGLMAQDKNILSKNPSLQSLSDRVHQLKGVRDWYAKHTMA